MPRMSRKAFQALLRETEEDIALGKIRDSHGEKAVERAAEALQKIRNANGDKAIEKERETLRKILEGTFDAPPAAAAPSKDRSNGR